MNMLNNLLFSNPFLMNLWVFLDGTAVKNPTKFQNLLATAAGIAGAIIALLLIVSIVKGALEYSKGSGSGGIGKIVGQVIFLIICIGLVVVAVNWQTLQSAGQKVGNAGVSIIGEAANSIGS